MYIGDALRRDSASQRSPKLGEGVVELSAEYTGYPEVESEQREHTLTVPQRSFVELQHRYVERGTV